MEVLLVAVDSYTDVITRLQVRLIIRYGLIGDQINDAVFPAFWVTPEQFQQMGLKLAGAYRCDQNSDHPDSN